MTEKQQAEESPEKPVPQQELSPLEKNLLEDFKEKILSRGYCQDGKLYIHLDPGSLLSVAEKLKHEEKYAFTMLHCITAVDYLKEEKIELTYHLYSMSQKHWLILKVRVDRHRPQIDSLCSLFPGANWLEREQYDLFGVIFLNHPDLRRILLPDYWPGYPLRKDWIEPDYKELTRLTLEGAFDT